MNEVEPLCTAQREADACNEIGTSRPEICSIGSANIDIRSFSNQLRDQLLYSRQLARELEEGFERDLPHCTEFDVTEYKNRSIAQRFRDSLTRLLSPLL